MICSVTGTYSPTPLSRVLLGKLTGSQLVKKFSEFYGTRRFITAFTSHAPVPILSQLDPVHTPTSHFLKIHLILSYHLCLGLQSSHHPSSFPTKNLYTTFFSPIRSTGPVHLILLDFIIRTILGEEYRSLSSSLCSFLQSPVASYLLGPNILFQRPILKHSKPFCKCNSVVKLRKN